MKRMVLLLAIGAVCIFGMQQRKLQDIKARINMLRAAGVPEEELADLKAQEAALEAEASGSSSSNNFDTQFARWKKIAHSIDENEVLEKSQLEYELLAQLAEKSASRWFYTGNLIDKALELKGISIENKPPFGLTIEVPRDVRKDLSNPLVYLVSFQQIENTCGFHALANAYAITQQVKDKNPITQENTRRIAQNVFQSRIESDQKFSHLVCPNSFNEPEYSDLLSVIESLGFNSNFGADPNFFLIDATNINDPVVQPIQAQQIRFNPVTNFMYRTRGHFFIISVVNRDDHYTMFLLDSANSPLEVGGEAARFVAHVDNLIQMAKAIDISGGASADFEREQAERHREFEEAKKKNDAKKRKTDQDDDSSQSATVPDPTEMNRRIVRQFNQTLSEDPTLLPYEEITEIWDGIRDKARQYLGAVGPDKQIVTIHIIAQGLGAVPTIEGKQAVREDRNALNYYHKLRDRALRQAQAFVQQEKYTRAMDTLRPFTPDTSVEILKIYSAMINYLAKESKRSAREQAEQALEYAKSLEREFNFFGRPTPEFREQKAALERLYSSLK